MQETNKKLIFTEDEIQIQIEEDYERNRCPELLKGDKCVYLKGHDGFHAVVLRWEL